MELRSGACLGMASMNPEWGTALVKSQSISSEQ